MLTTTTKTIQEVMREVDAFHDRPAISYSRIHMYDICPRQYQFHYVEGYRPKYEKACRVFGTAIHFALAEHFRSERDPVAAFTGEWDRLKYARLDYEWGESWLLFRQKGEALLGKFMAEERQKISNIQAIEKWFEIRIANVPLPIIGLIDLVADVEGVRTIVDFKTSSMSFNPWDAQLSDQLSTYFLAEPDVAQLAFCVFLKTKEPKIEWRFGRKDFRDLGQYLDKINYMIRHTEEGIFYKRPDRHCKQCDYRSLCLNDMARAARTLVQIKTKPLVNG